MKGIKNNKEAKRFSDATPRIARWLLCQKIGVVFYNSNIPYERLHQIKEYFERSDFLKEELFNIDLK